MSIPSNRPVLGKDLDEIKQGFGLSTADACWLFGLSITKWTQVARQEKNEPVKDPTLALLCRFLDQHPELSVMPKLPDADEMYTILNKVAPTDQKRFSVLLGSEASAGYRWLKHGSRQSPTLLRLMYYMKMALQSRTRGDSLDLLHRWAQTVEDEGLARGVENVFKTGRWVPPEGQPATPVPKPVKAQAVPESRAPAKASPSKAKTVKPAKAVKAAKSAKSTPSPKPARKRA